MEYWDKIQQVIRIILFAVGGYFLGSEVTEGELFNQFVGGVLAAGAFIWWLVWESKTKHKHEDT